jgi:23S rRNA (cytosine1962-C5)-methyltransferase
MMVWPKAAFSRSTTGGGQWTKSKVPEGWRIGYKDLSFNVRLMNFKHTGIFPEQASNWDFITEKIQNAGRPIKVLNLFAYTGAATVAAAKAGASVVHVDAAKGMVAYAKENAEASGLAQSPIRYIVDDCRKFIEKEIRRGKKYDAVIMDPPSYGRGPTGEVWKLEDSLYGFLELCTGVISDRPLFMLISSYTTGLSPSVLTYLADTVMSKRFGGSSESGELGLKVKETGLIFPCGSACRWIH